MNRRPSEAKSTYKGWLLALVAGILGLWQFHIPQFASNFDKFPGDRGDARLVAYLMEHWYQVFQGKWAWHSPGMFYPVQGTIGYADLLLGYGILHSGLRMLGLGIFEAAAFTIILFNFLNYLVCFVLLNKVLRFNLPASIAGAAFFAFNGPKLMQLGHPQLQPNMFLPLAIIGIVLFVQKRATLSQRGAFGFVALSALSIDLQLLTGFYSGWFFIFWSGLFLLVTLLFKATRSLVVEQVKKFWPALIGGLGVLIVGFIPLLMAYLPIFKSLGGRTYDQVRIFIPVPWSFLVTSPRNYLWGSVTAAIEATHPLNPEMHIGIGLVPSLAWLSLIVFAGWFLIRNIKDPERSERRTNLLFLSQLIIATTLFYLLGLRYWNDFSPWQFVYSFVPGAQAIRAVARYALVLALPLAIAFAFMIDFLIGRISRQVDGMRRRVLFVVLFVLTGFGLVEQFGRKEGFDGFSISAERTYLNRIAQRLPADCSAFYVRVGPVALRNIFEYHIDAVFVSVLKGIPTLNGYSGQLPANWNLWDMMEPGYENNVKRWVDEQQIKGNVCRLFLRDTTASNDIANPEVFIRQQYLDILRRQPDVPGLQTWLTTLNNCPRQGGRETDKNCDREFVSMAILQSEEFSQRGYFVLRLYLATLGRIPSHEEYLTLRDAIVGVPDTELKAKQKYIIEGWLERPEFESMYGGLTHAEYVDKLLTSAANSSAKRDELISALESRQKTHSQVLQAVIDDPETVKAFRNQAFVLMQFFGNLNRDPKPWEYEERLNKLNATGDYHQLVSDFIYSFEYQNRFGDQ